MRRLERVVSAPEGMANPVLAVAPGSGVEVGLLLESVVDGVLVTAEVDYPVTGECSRCLDPLATIRSTAFSELYLWESPEIVDPDTEPLPEVEAGFIDLADAIRDAIVLDMPLAPLCAEDCPGLCPRCGARLADEPDHRHDEVDPRWGALAAWQEAPDAASEEAMGDT